MPLYFPDRDKQKTLNKRHKFSIANFGMIISNFEITISNFGMIISKLAITFFTTQKNLLKGNTFILKQKYYVYLQK